MQRWRLRIGPSHTNHGAPNNHARVHPAANSSDVDDELHIDNSVNDDVDCGVDNNHRTAWPRCPAHR